MPEPKVIAIATADWHIHKFRAFNENNRRLKNCLRAMQDIANAADHFKVPILFAGDLYHTMDSVENETHSKTMLAYKKYIERRGIRFLAISGNHDMNQRNGIDNISPTHLSAYKVFSEFHLMDINYYSNNNMAVWGIPYMNSDKDLARCIRKYAKEAKTSDKKVRILMIHSDVPGAQTPEGIEVKETEHITIDMFKPWDLVVAGHIHRPQVIGNILMCGCPIHQNLGDEGDHKGYWLIYEGSHCKFIRLPNYPEFIRGEAKDDYDFWVAPEVVLADEEVETGEFAINQSRKKLASLYAKVKNLPLSKKRALIKILNEAE
jgi:DNA repair exonuclease SbcCD nuclease subunit